MRATLLPLILFILLLGRPSYAMAEPPLRQASALAGLTPIALVATGFSPTEVALFYGNLREAQETADLMARSEDLTAAEADLSTALEVLSFDPLNAAAAEAVVQAERDVVSHRVEVAAAVTAWLQRGCNGLEGARLVRLMAWRQAPPGLPAEFRVVQWSEPELRSLQAALLNERLAACSDIAIRPDLSSLLAGARSQTEIASAKLNITTNLLAVTAAFDEQSH